MLINNTTDDSFSLWSPPRFDLSLDTFSKDLFLEFDKAGQGLLSGSDTNSDKKPLSFHLEGARDVNIAAISDSLHGSSIRTSSQLTETTATTSVSNGEDLLLQEQMKEDRTKAKTDPRVHSQPPKDSGVALDKNDNDSNEAALEESRLDDSASSEINNQSASSPSASAFTTPATAALSRNNAVAGEQRLQYHSIDEIGKIVSKQYPPKPLQYYPVNNLPSTNTVTEKTTLNIRKSISLSRKKNSTIGDTLEAATKQVTEKNRESITDSSDTAPLRKLITNHNNTSPTTAMESISPFALQEENAARVNQKPKRRFISSFLFCY